MSKRADVRHALKTFAMLAQRTPREKAEERMRYAKRLMSEAAQAVIDRAPDAAELGDRARAELEAARTALRHAEAA